MRLKKKPKTNPPRFPKAKRSPTAKPSPTGKTISHPSSRIIGTRGIKKKELNAEIRLTGIKL